LLWLSRRPHRSGRHEVRSLSDRASPVGRAWLSSPPSTSPWPETFPTR